MKKNKNTLLNNITMKIMETKKQTIEEAAEINLTNLCHYNKRNPDCSVDDEDIEDHKNNLFKKNKTCSCDNCFYGRTKLTEQLIWQQARSYSEEEMLQALNIGFTSTDETWEECVEFAKEQFKKK